jgi:hypothetical protein
MDEPGDTSGHVRTSATGPADNCADTGLLSFLSGKNPKKRLDQFLMDNARIVY